MTNVGIIIIGVVAAFVILAATAATLIPLIVILCELLLHLVMYVLKIENKLFYHNRYNC